MRGAALLEIASGGLAAGRPPRPARPTVALVLATVAVAVVCALAGCGSGAATGAASPTALRLQREDLVAVAHALRSAERPLERELVAARAGWAVVADGLPANIPASTLPTVRTAVERAHAVVVPPLLTEERSRELTGPGAAIAGQFRTFATLATRGWTTIAAAIEGIEHGTPTVASFHRANVALYIDSVYDGHFGLAQIGKNLLEAYDVLGGATAFAGTLTQREVDVLAGTYSPSAARLEPHPGVALGS